MQVELSAPLRNAGAEIDQTYRQRGSRLFSERGQATLPDHEQCFAGCAADFCGYPRRERWVDDDGAYNEALHSLTGSARARVEPAEPLVTGT